MGFRIVAVGYFYSSPPSFPREPTIQSPIIIGLFKHAPTADLQSPIIICLFKHAPTADLHGCAAAHKN